MFMATKYDLIHKYPQVKIARDFQEQNSGELSKFHIIFLLMKQHLTSGDGNSMNNTCRFSRIY